MANRAVSILAVCMLVQECVNVCLEYEKWHLFLHTHIHTGMNGRKNWLRPPPPKAKVITPNLVLHMADWIVAISTQTRMTS